MREQFLNEIETDEKNINEQIFKEYFKYHFLSFLVKDLYKKIQNGRIVNYINGSLIDLKNSINSKKIPQDKSS